MAGFELLSRARRTDLDVLAVRTRMFLADELAIWGALHCDIGSGLSPTIVGDASPEGMDSAERFLDVTLAPVAWALKKYGETCISAAMNMVNSTGSAPAIEGMNN